MFLKHELAFGIHTVSVLLSAKPELVKEIWLQQDSTNKRIESISRIAKNIGIKPQIVRKSIIDREAQCSTHQGVLALIKKRVSLDEVALYTYLDTIDIPKEKPLFLIIDSLDDPQNLGACLRTAECASVSGVILTKDKNPKASSPVVGKVACGAVDLLPIYEVTNLATVLKRLQEYGIWIVGTSCDKGATPVYKIDLKGPVGLVIGSEGRGMRRLTTDKCDFLTYIPLQGQIESLNVSVAAGVVLFEASRQRLLAEGGQQA